MTRPSTRREFLRTSTLAGAGVLLAAREGFSWRRRSANERLDLGIVGVANRGRDNLDGVMSENIVALCDVDEGFLTGAAQAFPGAKTYFDFRLMLEKEKLDAVVVSTPDHTHSAVTMAALDSGLHVYCEKPLTHTVAEARAVAELAARKGLVTQMGTQIHAGDNYRRVVELVRSGAIGKVREVHVMCGKSWGADARPAGEHPTPASLRWDLWIGPAAELAYNPDFHPASWRRYWPFGGGTLADMACHHVDLSVWALELGAPERVHAEGPPVHEFGAPSSLVVHWSFASAGDRPAVELWWHDGGRRPEELLLELGLVDWRDGTLFVGEKGWIVADYDRHAIGPVADFAGFEPPAPSIPTSIGHHREWIEACKTGGPTTCSFAYAGPLTEAVLLGTVAYRAGGELGWDARAMKSPDNERAASFVAQPRRPGW